MGVAPKAGVEQQGITNEASARFFRVLGDPTRLAIAQHLLKRPHTVSELVDKLGLSQSRVSNHLACLRWCRFVNADRQGRQIIYSINDVRLRRLLQLAAEMVRENEEYLAGCERIGPDWI
ncbi:MAG TPA: metalloregulator ArsR/SmtB family transcription factor [Planosporangium sp.]|jgi:ArsR family transcriptional regulator|nr:metalloregulator ArsR/SmtB family transcription factor [Planosporangium sp.]